MAGPQFFTPKSVQPSRPRRRFTVEQANRSLPLVKRIVADIVRTNTQYAKLRAQVERTGSKDAKEQSPQQAELERMNHRLEDYLDELSEVGCELKDPQMGLIDFTGRHQGRDICLCWKLGEDKIAHWHEQDTGFAGRQPVSTLKEGE